MSTLLDYMELKVTQENIPGGANQNGSRSSTIKSQGMESTDSFLKRMVRLFLPRSTECTNVNARKTPYDYIHVKGLR